MNSSEGRSPNLHTEALLAALKPTKTELKLWGLPEDTHPDQVEAEFRKTDTEIPAFVDSYSPYLISEIPEETPGLREGVADLLYFLRLNFPGSDDRDLLPEFLKAIGENPAHKSITYVALLQKCLEEAAAFGYVSVFMPFNAVSRQKTYEATGKDIFDVRILLALRMYIAQITLQSISQSKKKLEGLQAQNMSGKDKLNSIQAHPSKAKILAVLLGRSLHIERGKMVDAEQLNLQYTVNEQTSYDRQRVGRVYIPDEPRAQKLWALGQELGLPDFAHQGIAIGTIGNLTREQAKYIFPDLESSSVQVDEDHKDRIALALALPYDETRDLLAAEMGITRS
jgi:hypothetical protein